MSKNDIIKELSKQLQINKNLSGQAYNVLISSITQILQEKGSIRLHNFGTLYTILCKEKRYHNPKTKTLEKLPPKKRVKFRASKFLSEIIT